MTSTQLLDVLLGAGGAAALFGGAVRLAGRQYVESIVRPLLEHEADGIRVRLEAAEQVHGDLGKLNVTLMAIAENTKATHRATVELSEKVGTLGERMAAVEAVQAIATPPKRQPRGR